MYIYICIYICMYTYIYIYIYIYIYQRGDQAGVLRRPGLQLRPYLLTIKVILLGLSLCLYKINNTISLTIK